MDYDNNVLNELQRISHLLHRHIAVLRSEETFEGLTGKRGRLLNYIVEVSQTRPLLQRELETEFTIRRSTATQLLQELERYGYIVRRPDEKDQRQRVIEPTKKAIDCHDKIMAELEEVHSKMTADFTEKDFEDFRRVCQKIIINLND